MILEMKKFVKMRFGVRGEDTLCLILLAHSLITRFERMYREDLTREEGGE